MSEQQQAQEVDEKGVPLTNRMKEMERKFQEQLERERASFRQELDGLKARLPTDPEPDTEDMSKADLMEFVKNPRGYIANTLRQDQFQREIPSAEAWIKQQQGYSSDDDSRIFQIIKENKLDTPYHSPMERAKTAWRLLDAEKRTQQAQAANDEKRREESIAKSATEGTGKATPKQQPITRNDILKKLADAERSGDLDASIRYTSMLEDHR